MKNFSRDTEAEAFRSHSRAEAARPESEVRDQYRERLTEALSWEGLNPCPKPITRGCEEVGAWIDPSSVLVERTTLYHHSEEELLDFAVEHRGNADLHLNSMSDLWVMKYPSPVGKEPLHMISHNGHHRRLVMRITGHERVGAMVKGSAPGRWVVQLHNTRWMFVFERLGLATLEDSGERGYPTLIDPLQIVGWVLPPGDTPSSEVAASIARNMSYLEQAVGHIDDPRVAVLRDEIALTGLFKELRPQSRWSLLRGKVANLFRR